MQLHQHYDEFVKRDTEVVVVGPDSAKDFIKYWAKQELPFIGLADPKHIVADRYMQEVSIWKLGRMPALMIVDKKGRVRFTHYAENQRDYPAMEEMYEVLDKLRTKEDEAGEQAA